MANQIQGTVYQIDGSPLSAPIQIAFLTSNVCIREFSTSLIPQVNSQIIYYPNTSNQLQEQTFLVSETITALVTAANTNGTTQVSGTVLEINQEPQEPGGVTFSFPAQGISIWPISNPIAGGVHSYLEFKNKKYYLLETEAALVAAANAGGGGGGGTSTGINGLNGTTNIGLGGTILNNTTIVGANYNFDYHGIKDLNLETTGGNAIYMQDGGGGIRTKQNGQETGLLIYGDNAILGDYTNGFGIEFNRSNSFMATQWSANYVGLYIDFSGGTSGSVKYVLGDPSGFLGNSSNIEVNGTLDSIFLKNSQEQLSLEGSTIKTSFSSGGYDAGIYLDFANRLYKLGDFYGNNNGSYIDINDDQTTLSLYTGNTAFLLDNSASFIKTNWNANDIGLYLDFANNQYGIIDSPVSQQGILFNNNNIGKGVYIGFGDSSGFTMSIQPSKIVTNFNGSDLGLSFSPLLNECWFGLSDSYGLYLLSSDDNITLQNSYNGVRFINDSGNQHIYTSINGSDYTDYIGFDISANVGFVKFGRGLESFEVNIDVNNRIINIGDWSGNNNGTSLSVNDFVSIIEMTAPTRIIAYSGSSGFKAEAGISAIGDIDSQNNGCQFGVDDGGEYLIASPNLTVGTSGSSSGQHLKIRIGANSYVIELRNP